MVDIITLDCTDEGLKIHSMDKAQIALIDVLLPIKMFSIYNCQHNHALGINVASLLKVLKLAKSNDIITLKYQQNTHQLLLNFADTSIYFVKILLIFLCSCFFFNFVVIINHYNHIFR